MTPLRNEWPPSISPYRHYVRVKGGIKETGEKLPDGAVAIVVPVRNGMQFFKLCFYSVTAFTDHPYTFTVVDHVGDLDTKKLLNALSLNHQIYIERYDDEQFNFAAEVNTGLRAAFKFPQAKYGLILNADTIVEPFWLSKMMRIMDANARIGIVGPCSNMALPEQKSFDRHDEPTVAQRVSGFCMLFRRSLWEELGGFDEEFVGGGFEDWDFCERARRKRWHVMIDGMTYVHHFYKQFRRNDHDQELLANEARFFVKHPMVADLVKRGNLLRVGE